ncbi:hypothetical protein CH372_11555 [Leptospira meyeri]|uniref:S41 family peptidase n=1 Tax=Leptospira meyeri TaxID=29508 RepID=UPI000C2A3A49|nr:S41 family peptidase [Leptospira meyeri]PKA11933.1 hypothetical protein CH372_11555 [Leptospira meyeri]
MNHTIISKIFRFQKRYQKTHFTLIVFVLSLFLLVIVFISCNQQLKKHSRKSPAIGRMDSLKKDSMYPYLYQGNLNMSHFLQIKEEVNLFHLEEKRINSSSGYASAIKAAYATISIEFYPKEYYEKYKTDSQIIAPGLLINSNSENYILIQKPNEIDSKMTESQKNKRKELSIHYSKLHFDQQEFETSLNNIYEITKSKNNTNTNPDLIKENLIFTAINGYLEELDRSTRIWKIKKYITTSEEDDWNVLFNISHKTFRNKKEILYLKVDDFDTYDDNTNTADATKKIILHELKSHKNKIAGIVLDFRENNNGSLSIGKNFLSLFSSKPTLYIEVNSSKSNPQSPSTSFEKITNLPLAIVVNENTEGIAELVAGSLRENENALVLGSRTYGSGSLQSSFRFKPNNGYGYKITTTKVTLPSGYEIEGNGILPDLLIENKNRSEKIRTNKDNWNILKTKINPTNQIQNPNPQLISLLKKIEKEDVLPKTENSNNKDYVLEKSLFYFQLYLETLPETP